MSMNSGSASMPRLPALSRLFATLRAVGFVTYKEWAAYRSHMLLSLLVGPAFFLSQFFIWTAVFAGHANLGGFDLAGMLAYYGISTIIYYLTMDFADWNLQMHVRAGSFLTFMLRPLSHRWFAFSQKVGHRILGFLFEFLPVWCIISFGFRIPLIPASWLWSALSILLGFVMMFFLNYTVGLLSFWLVRTDGIRSLFALFRDLLAGTFIPLSFFPQSFQYVLFFLPFQFTCYVPVRVFLGHYELAGLTIGIPAIVGIQALAVAAMWLVSSLVWHFAARQFTGAGT
jgi:ABC-2 type transport system permease protein